jgi:hypothetical protein
MIDQQNTEEISRAITLPITTDPSVSTELPAPLADATIGWNATADALVNNPASVNIVAVDASATADYIGAAAGDGVLRVDSSMLYTDGGDFVTIGVDYTAIPASDFVDLNDTPASYAGQAMLGLRVNAGETGLEFVSLSTGATFLAQTDTPVSYVGAALQNVRVNAGETGLEFVAAGGSDFISLTDTPANYVGSANFILRVNGTPDAIEFQNESTIDHDVLTNYVADEHVAHAGVTLTAGDGLSGGGTIAASRTFDVDIASEGAVAVAGADELLFADVSNSDAIQKCTAQEIANLAGSAGAVIDSTYFTKWDMQGLNHGVLPSGDFGAAQQIHIFGGNYRLNGKVTSATGGGMNLLGDGTNRCQYWLSDGTGTAALDVHFPFVMTTGKHMYWKLVFQHQGSLSGVNYSIGFGSDATNSAPNSALPSDSVVLRITSSSFFMTTINGGTRTDTNFGSSDTNEHVLECDLLPGVSLDYTFDGTPQTQKTANIPTNGTNVTPYLYGETTNNVGIRIKEQIITEEP